MIVEKRKGKDMYGASNWFRYWLCVIFVGGFASVSSLGQITLKFKNESLSSVGYRAEHKNGGVGSWGTTTFGTAGAGATVTYAAGSFASGTLFRVRWNGGSQCSTDEGCAGTNGVAGTFEANTGGTWTGTGGGSWQYTGGTANLTFQMVDASTPDEYCIEFNFINYEVFPQAVQVLKSPSLDIIVEFIAEPRTIYPILIGPQTNAPYSILSIESRAVGTNSYGSGVQYLLAEASEWRTNDCEFPDPIEVERNNPTVFLGNSGASNYNTSLGFTPNLGADTNSAQEGTLKQGFGAVFTVNQGGFENLAELGRIANQLQATNNGISDAIYLALGHISTNIATLVTNGTNGIQKVGGSSEGMETNANNWLSYASSHMTDGSNTFTSARTSLNPINNFGSSASYTLDPDYWVINLPSAISSFGGPSTINLNPMANTVVAGVASWFKTIITWFSCFFLLRFIAEETKKTAAAQGAFQQGKAPNIGVSVLGTGVQSSLPMHLPIFVIVSGLLTSLFALFITYFISSAEMATVLVNPFTTLSVPTQQGFALMLRWFDFFTLLAHLVIGVGFRLAMSAHLMMVQVAIRAMPSAIVFAVLSWDVNAAMNLQADNMTGDTFYVAGVAGYLQVDQGERLELQEYSGSDLQLYDAPGGVILGTISNHWTGSDADVSAVVGKDGSVYAVSWTARPTAEAAMYEGFKVGGGLFGFVGILWLLKMIRADRAGEGALG